MKTCEELKESADISNDKMQDSETFPGIASTELKCANKLECMTVPE